MHYKTVFLAPKRAKLRLVSFSVTKGVVSCIISHFRRGNGCVDSLAPTSPSFLAVEADTELVISCSHSPSAFSEYPKRNNNRGSLLRYWSRSKRIHWERVSSESESVRMASTSRTCSERFWSGRRESCVKRRLNVTRSWTILFSESFAQ